MNAGTVVEPLNLIRFDDQCYLINLERSNEQKIPSPAVLVDLEEMILIGIGRKIDFPDIIAQLRQIMPLDRLKYVIVPSLETHLITTMIALAKEGAHPTLVIDEKLARLLNLTSTAWPLELVGERNTQLILKSGRILSFIPTPFLITPGAFIVYDNFGKTLFANYVFETSGNVSAKLTRKEHVSLIQAFCQNYVPSADFLRPVILKIAKLEIRRAITQSGVVLDNDTLRYFCLELANFEFYNNNVYVTQSGEKSQDFNYEGIANQILLKLKAVYGQEAVMTTFAKSDFTLDGETMQITAATETGPKLWNRLFETIYARRGIPWITVLEPIIGKIVELYGIAKPSIYQSVLAENEQKVRQLDTEKSALVTKLSILESHLTEALDKLSKDPLTHHYNELFLKQYLGEQLSAKPAGIQIFVDVLLFYIQIDNILAINAKYSVQAGDETIRNLGYILEQIVNADDLIIKRNGPGFIVVVSDLAGRDPGNFAQRIQNSAKDSEAFIEPISLSVAIVKTSEFPKITEQEAMKAKLLSTGETRIKAAARGVGLIIDEKTRLEKAKTGKILIVDAEEINLTLLKSLFYNENYEVQIASDGLVARQMTETIAYDAILAERTIPKLDGMMLKQSINQSALNKRTLFILLTYNKNTEIVNRANQLSIDYVIQKPVIFEEIAGLIERTLNLGGR